jgi:hypothetical protein
VRRRGEEALLDELSGDIHDASPLQLEVVHSRNSATVELEQEGAFSGREVNVGSGCAAAHERGVR